MARMASRAAWVSSPRWKCLSRMEGGFATDATTGRLLEAGEGFALGRVVGVGATATTRRLLAAGVVSGLFGRFPAESPAVRVLDAVACVSAPPERAGCGSVATRFGAGLTGVFLFFFAGPGEPSGVAARRRAGFAGSTSLRDSVAFRPLLLARVLTWRPPLPLPLLLPLPLPDARSDGLGDDSSEEVLSCSSSSSPLPPASLPKVGSINWASSIALLGSEYGSYARRLFVGEGGSGDVGGNLPYIDVSRANAEEESRRLPPNGEV